MSSITQAQQKVGSLARELLAFNTINPPGQEWQCAHYIGRLLENAGFETRFFEFAENRTSLVARLTGSGDKPPICFTGHLDTVPLGMTIWTHDPFGGELDSNSDRLYGRGSSDMKGAVAAMVVMALEIGRIEPRRAGISLIFTAGEETCCQGARHLAGLEAVLDAAGALVVGEPTANSPWLAHKGCVRFLIRTSGISAHASMPEQGDNAIHKAAEAIMKLRNFNFGVLPHPLLGSPTLNVGTISGGMNINSVPDQATIGIDIRSIPGQDEQAIQQKLRATLGNEAEIALLEGASSIETDLNHPWIQEVVAIMERLTGERSFPAGASYFSDASVLVPALGNPPTVILGPGEPQMAHRTDEFCYISKLETATEAYTAIARNWCGF
jgi:succinyl-diaminopimelate desuccinylase